MKIRKDVSFEYNEMAQAYDFELKHCKVKKVTSRMYPILLGKSGFNGVGSAVLDRCGLIDFDDIDKWYKIRGAIAEYVVGIFVKNMYKQYGIDIKMKHFTPKSVGYDNFKKNERFGAVIDWGISEPESQRGVIEVKSKNIKYKDKIQKEERAFEEEVMQGEMIAHLSNVDKLLMGYVLFTDQQEKFIQTASHTVDDGDDFDVKKYLDFIHMKPEHFDVIIKKYTINHDEVQKSMDKAYDTLHHIVGLNYISEIHFTTQEKQYLNKELRERKGLPEPTEDSPF
jgi:hypothetical protein